MSSKTWYCHNRSCGAPLGVTVDGELSVQANNPNVQLICTEGAILNLVCGKCGRINKWVPKDSALIKAVLNTHLLSSLITDISMKIMHIKNAVINQDDNDNDSEEDET